MRAQTTLDFLVGASLFLLAVAITIGMVPGMLDPFALSDSSATVEANRAATALATDELGSPDTPYVLSEPAVETFFDLDQSGVRDRLKVDDAIAVNVTLANETARIDAVGPSVPDDASITTAWRTVAYRNEQATLRVRTW